jgi:hypothetical protein
MEEKKEGMKLNKAVPPASNKSQQVKIQMRLGRAMAGVTVDERGFATVDAETAAYLVKINYAIVAEEN